ncbi:MAG: MBG domain-containing protein, partial [Micrococcales bacterium]
SLDVEAGYSLYNGDTLGDASYAYDVATPVNAGTYTITPSAVSFTSGSASNYNITYDNGQLTIAKKTVHITMDNLSKSYGASDPTFTYTLDNPAELLEGDTITGSASRESGEAVGSYAYKVGTLTAGGNYNLVITNGTFTINKLHVKVTPTAGQTKVYGDKDPAYTFTTDVTLPFGESLSGSLDRTGGENVGSYDFNLGNLVESNSNYELELVPATFGITKRDITVSVDPLEKFYGDADPAFTFSYSPTELPNGTAIVLTGSPERAVGENVGEYAITKGSLDGGDNFTVTGFTGAKLTIKKRPISIVAADQSAKYGAALPSNSWSLAEGSSLGYQDAISGVTFDYSSTPRLHVGSYDIIPSAATFSTGDAANYDITYVNGTIVITKASLTVTIDNASSNWGEAAPSFKVLNTDGLVDSDAIGSMSYTVDGNSSAPTAIGSYVLNGTLDGMDVGSLEDYEVTVVPATYLINGPQVINFDPPQGPTAGGTQFTIYGTGFGYDVPTVIFDGVPATDVVLLDSGTITGVTPPHAEGPVDVQLVIGDQTIDLGKLFTYIPPPPAPVIDVLWPGISPTGGGSTITITGANFCGSDNKGSKVYVDGVLAKNIVVSPDCKTITFKTPTYKIGVYRVEVRNKDGVVGYDQAIQYVTGGTRSLSKLIIFKGDSSILKPGAKVALRSLASHLKGKADVVVNVYGWVHRTTSSRIDAALSLARAKNVVKFLKSVGVVGTFNYAPKGIYHKGDYRDRRAEVDATWTE